MLDWIAAIIAEIGAFGVALLMLLENIFPPIPSEIVMPVAGFVATERGVGGIASMVVAGTAGSVAGALFWYWIGCRIGIDRMKRFAARHGRWLTLTPDDIDRVDRWFDRWGWLAVFLGRLVPTVRTLVSIPAGASGMALGPFLFWTTLGSALWSGALVAAGAVLGENYVRVSDWLGPISTAVIVVLVLGYLWRVVTFRADKIARREDR